MQCIRQQTMYVVSGWWGCSRFRKRETGLSEKPAKFSKVLLAPFYEICINKKGPKSFSMFCPCSQCIPPKCFDKSVPPYSVGAIYHFSLNAIEYHEEVLSLLANVPT